MLLPSFSEVRYTPLGEKPSWSNRRRWVSVLKYAGIVLSAALVVLAALHISGIKRITLPHRDPEPSPPAPSEPEPAPSEPDASPPAPSKPDVPMLGNLRGPDNIIIPQIPKNFKTVGMVFFGRKSKVEILDCYLKRNLRSNGGVLDEVMFIVKTTEKSDLAYLDHLLTTSPSYLKKTIKDPHSFHGATWDVVERGVMYIKIDDDVVFIGNTTLQDMVDTKAAHPEKLLVSANVINNPAMSWVHYHMMGAIRPYLPEMVRPENDETGDVVSWRASELPVWRDDEGLFSHREVFDAPSANHRWLPLGPGYTNEGTPITGTTYDAFGPAWNNWAIAAQEHYSFLEHLEKDDLDVYEYDLWDYHFGRLSINLICVWGDDIVDSRPIRDDDEQFLTVELPRKLGRHAIMHGKAIASHFSFGAQNEGLKRTDLLSRYKAYADENICPR